MNIKKHIPNTITCCNLLSGCVASVYAFERVYPLAFAFIIAGAVFDFFDGNALLRVVRGEAVGTLVSDT